MRRKETKEGYVLILNILGFEHRTSKLEYDFIKCWKSLKKDILAGVLEMKNGNNVHIDTLLLTDTLIVCFSLKSNDSCSMDNLLLDIPGSIQSFFFKFMEENTIILAGALSFGKFIFCAHDNLVIGPAISEATEWHKSTDWIGIVLTPSAAAKLLGIKPTPEYPIASFKDFIWYNMPFHNEFMKHCSYSVLWIGRQEYTSTEHNLYNRLRWIFPKVAHYPKYSNKYLNTLNYLRFVFNPSQNIDLNRRPIDM